MGRVTKTTLEAALRAVCKVYALAIEKGLYKERRYMNTNEEEDELTRLENRAKNLLKKTYIVGSQERLSASEQLRIALKKDFELEPSEHSIRLLSSWGICFVVRQLFDRDVMEVAVTTIKKANGIYFPSDSLWEEYWSAYGCKKRLEWAKKALTELH